LLQRAHKLRLLGRVVRTPPNRTVVALIDAEGSRATAPDLDLRAVSTPAVPVPRFEPPPPSGDATVAYISGGEHPPWGTAPREDPVIRRFLDAAAPTDASAGPSC
jgi:hypothetical protein